MSFYRDYNEAFNSAVRLARLLRREVGLEKFSEFGKPGFRVFSLPKPENRCGFELRCQVVGPNDPLMSGAPEPIVEIRA